MAGAVLRYRPPSRALRASRLRPRDARPLRLRRSPCSLTLAATVPNVFNEMIAYGCLALASGIALARPRPFRPDAVPRQRPHRWRSRTCRARPLRSHRSPCSLTLAAAVTNVVNESDRVAITASPRASRWRASALGIGGRQGRAPLDQMKKVEGLASVRDRSSETRQGRTFPSRGRSRPRPHPDLPNKLVREGRVERASGSCYRLAGDAA